MTLQSAAIDGSCRYCGQQHFGFGVCPRVSAIEYYPDGTPKRVEFYNSTQPNNSLIPPITPEYLKQFKAAIEKAEESR